VKVFENLVLTSTEEPAVQNLLNVAGADFAAAVKYAQDTYGVELELVLGAKGVYYYDNTGAPVTIASNKYSYDPATGIMVVYGDDSIVKNYYADFTAVMTSRICGGEHTVPFRVVLKK
jgi:hypothetical protein